MSEQKYFREMLKLLSMSTSDEIDEMEFTVDQMTALCKNLSGIPGTYSRKLIGHRQMTPEYLDLMMSNPTIYDVEDIIVYCDCIQPRHIEMLLSWAEENNYSDEMVDMIMREPACTEAMKVKYQLKKRGG